MEEKNKEARNLGRKKIKGKERKVTYKLPDKF
jgi:hypothetical protein